MRRRQATFDSALLTNSQVSEADIRDLTHIENCGTCYSLHKKAATLIHYGLYPELHSLQP